MKKILILFVLLISAAAFGADSFEDFKAQSENEFESSKQGFSEYKKETEEAFDTYKKIIDEEFQNYKNNILKNWDTAEVSTNTRWVEYLNGYRIRKTVDFENGYIRIDVLNGSAADIKPVLLDLLKEDRANAFRRDPVSFNTEKRLREEVPDALTAKIDDDPVVAPLYTDKPMTDKNADELAEKLLDQSETSQQQSEGGKPYVSMQVNLPADSYQKAAEKVLPYVDKYTAEFKMQRPLVLAVIFHESRFNPLAKSHVPAYGLMQIVPKSAGVDAMQFLEGKKKVLAPSYLYNPENNVKVGTAYLHILYNRYFKKVKNPQSRLYCSIAAYNTGAGNVAYTFNTSNGGRYSLDRAVPVINSMSPDQVYSRLKNKLRYEEARNYIVKVTTKMKDY